MAKNQNKQPIDVSVFPQGLSMKELLKQPELKSINSWFTWAGVVQIVTGLLNFVTVGEIAESSYQMGYNPDSGTMSLISITGIAFIVLGILLLTKRTTTIAYIVGIVGIVWAVIALATGGSVGAGIIAVVLALVGARRLDGVWKDYQAFQQGQGNYAAYGTQQPFGQQQAHPSVQPMGQQPVVQPVGQGFSQQPVVQPVVQPTGQQPVGQTVGQGFNQQPVWVPEDDDDFYEEKTIASFDANNASGNVYEDKTLPLIFDEQPIHRAVLTRVSDGRTIDCTGDIFTVGKSPSYCDYVLSDNQKISRKHAAFHCKNDQYFVIDSSKNGTTINGIIVPKDKYLPIKAGDRISFADEEYIFTLG